MKFVLASHNKGKLAEMQAVLADLGIEVVMPADLGIYVDVEETGDDVRRERSPEGQRHHGGQRPAGHRR